jgi:hypothetical protein
MQTSQLIENIVHHNVFMAVIIRAAYKEDGIQFFTPDDFSQQLGYMSRPKGYVIAPHIHCHQERKVFHTQEVLVVRTGRIRVDFFNDRQEYLESRVISSGDVILLAAAGHGFEFLDDAEMIEIKQGPFSAKDDKIRFPNPEIKKLRIVS